MNNLGMARQPDMYRGPPLSDFKPPTETQMPSAPSNPKKRRKTNASAANNAIQPTPPPTPQDLLPPPLSGYGDTVHLTDPFDDTPPQNSPMSSMSMNMSHMNHMGMNHHHPHHPHMNPHPHMGPAMRGMNPMMMNMAANAGHGHGPPHHHMSPVPPSHMNVNNRGMSPMSQIGNLSPMGAMGPNPMNVMSPGIGMQQHGSGRSMSGSPIHPPQMPQIGSPINAINSPLGSGSGPMSNGPMAMHSPIPGNRMNGMPPLNPSQQQSPHHQQQQQQQQHPMGNMQQNANLNPGIGPGGMMNNSSNGSNTPVSTNNNNSPTTTLSSVVPPNINSNNNNNSLPGSNNGPTTTMTNPSVANTNTTNSSNINQNNQMSHQGMGPGMNVNNMGGMPPMGMGIGGPGAGGMYSGPKPMPVSAGKVYPADTPMVFNPQNPNAPPIYPCGVCHKEVHDNDQGLLCESGCNFWFHRTCSGLTEAAYQLIHFEVYAEWCCDKCLASKNIPMVKFKP